MKSDFGDLLRAEDYRGLADLVRERLMVDVLPEALRQAVKMHLFLHSQQDELRYQGSNENAYPWLKNRLEELAAFKVGGLADSFARPTCTLHTFFINIEETAEMMERLWNENPKYNKAIKEMVDPKSDVARSRLFKTAQVLNPIDKTAVRVAPPPPENKAG